MSIENTPPANSGNGQEALFQLTHKQAVKRVRAWASNTKNCGVVFAELSTQNSETPDVIGFYGAGGSILIECKVSRSDFHADKTKHFRRIEQMGMGDFRYYAAPKGVLSVEDLPEGWGLLEIQEHSIRVRKEATHKTACKRSEVKMLMSAIRRLEISTAVFVQSEPTQTDAPSSSTSPAAPAIPTQPKETE